MKKYLSNPLGSMKPSIRFLPLAIVLFLMLMTNISGFSQAISPATVTVNVNENRCFRNRAYLSLTDIIRHENTHQLQILSGRSKTMTPFMREFEAYTTNTFNPATSTTIKRISNQTLKELGLDVPMFYKEIFRFTFPF